MQTIRAWLVTGFVYLMVLIVQSQGDQHWSSNDLQMGMVQYTQLHSANGDLDVGRRSWLTNWIPFSRQCGCKQSSCGCCVTYHGIMQPQNSTVCLSMEATEVCCREALSMNLTAFNYSRSFSIFDDITLCPTIPNINAGICIHPYGLHFNASEFRACVKTSLTVGGVAFGQVDLDCVVYTNGKFSLQSRDGVKTDKKILSLKNQNNVI